MCSPRPARTAGEANPGLGLVRAAQPDFGNRVRASFARQRLMQTLGAVVADVRPGVVEIELPFRDDLTQQHGYLHAAAITAIVDSACGYAALTLMEPEVEVLSVEFKVNLLAPAAGERFLAVGRVLRPGRTLTVCSGEVYAVQGGSRKLICAMQATMIAAPSASAGAVRPARARRR